MGNCIMKKQPAIQYNSDDWGSPKAKVDYVSGSHCDDCFVSEKKVTTTTEVKIKISKKQLEELLGRTDVQGLSVQQVLGRLMDASDGFESHQPSWRPALQSIPE
uniref:uncharacterized protein LOC122602190 n=1 Tax=Erigeron canadensis TaxID=72917 RepID=UPI001CB89EC4|nr:uncharacterized protein LOC122602190 [Erigeron canadensis]